MKIITWNVNGIRSSVKKGFWDFVWKEKPDIVALQEIKSSFGDFPMTLFDSNEYKLVINPAVKKGYSGTAIYSKNPPISVNIKLGLNQFDSEGRIIELKYPEFLFINLYLPHGGRDKSKLDYKLKAYKYLHKRLAKINSANNIVIAGDFNIAHKDIDLARPRENKNNIMFTPQERRQVDKIIKLGFTDSFRYLNSKPGNYTWWSYRSGAKKKNIGWRIDYIFVTNTLLKNLKSAKLFPELSASDHCPVEITLDI